MVTPHRTVAGLIDRARDPNVPAADRHAAFAEIVREFQDLAVACARARLHDPALAEDAAQDAFLVAWVRLDQLRDPHAFAGWIRRLVLTQCYRRLRCARLPIVSDEFTDIAAPESTRTSDSAALQLALANLAPADRLVLILFYGSERTQAEIADWLRVPATTIARRLAHAKRRLRHRLLDAVAGELRKQHRVAASGFELESSGRLRRVCTDDASGVDELVQGFKRLTGGVHGPTQREPVCAYLIDDPRGKPVAYASAIQTIFQPIFDLQLAIGRSGLERHAGDVLLMQIVEDLIARDAISLQWQSAFAQSPVVDFLMTRGFDVLVRAEDWRLDAAGAAHLLADSSAMATSRWHFAPLHDLLASTDLFDAALELTSEALAEDPSMRAFLPIHPDTLRRVVRQQRDGVLAIAEGNVCGIIGASSDDVLPDGRRINVVVVRNSFRQQGLGRALLHHLLAQSSAAPVRLVRPSNPVLTAWLSRCGFVKSGEQLLLERVLRKTVQVDAGRLNEYVGDYVVEQLATSIRIERYADTLISKTRDMRDVWLASSDCEFFTRHHHGRGRFERDETGRVARLVYVEGPHTVVAARQDGSAARYTESPRP